MRLHVKVTRSRDLTAVNTRMCNGTSGAPGFLRILRKCGAASSGVDFEAADLNVTFRRARRVDLPDADVRNQT